MHVIVLVQLDMLTYLDRASSPIHPEALLDCSGTPGHLSVIVCYLHIGQELVSASSSGLGCELLK